MTTPSMKPALPAGTILGQHVEKDYEDFTRGRPLTQRVLISVVQVGGTASENQERGRVNRATVIFLVLGLGAVVMGVLIWRDEGPGFFLGGLAFLLAVLGLTGWAYYPFSADYHQWRETSGVVQDVSSRILPSGDSIEQKFVVDFGDGEEYGCQDTRCTLVKPGQTLTLSCKKSWQYAGRDGWDCKYVGRTGGAE